MNLHVDKGDFPIEIEPLRSKTDYLITPKEPLAPGVYAFQTQELLSSEQAALSRSRKSCGSCSRSSLISC